MRISDARLFAAAQGPAAAASKEAMLLSLCAKAFAGGRTIVFFRTKVRSCPGCCPWRHSLDAAALQQRLRTPSQKWQRKRGTFVYSKPSQKNCHRSAKCMRKLDGRMTFGDV